LQHTTTTAFLEITPYFDFLGIPFSLSLSLSHSLEKGQRGGRGEGRGEERRVCMLSHAKVEENLIPSLP